MNRRMILNLMIFGLVTFFLVFSLVHRNFVERQGEQVELVESKWQQRRLVPLPWTIKRIEYGERLLKKTNDDWQMTAAGQVGQDVNYTKLVSNWQQLTPNRIDFYEQLPEQGSTLLVFIEEDSQPLIFRVVVSQQALVFYRMLDQRKFTFANDAHLLP